MEHAKYIVQSQEDMDPKILKEWLMFVRETLNLATRLECYNHKYVDWLNLSKLVFQHLWIFFSLVYAALLR